ncbi:MAG: SurA N-terminal domain-containing protein [Acidobacteriota bacterium]|nr:SurA N-terminal domain-containing protein [Acidobacteriota bacterium]
MKNSGLLSQLRKVVFVALVGGLFVFGGAAIKADAQRIVDKTVATISDGVSSSELITYSDLLWQLALDPNAPLNPPNSGDLKRVLQMLIDQRLFALEARRLPRNAPIEAEVNEEIRRVLALFPSTAEFERRLRSVGFESVTDENFRRMMEQRVAIEKYVKFRFESFVIITPQEEEKYYRDVFVPEFRRRNPGVLVPALAEVRERINQNLTAQKVEQEIERFLEDAKRRVEIEVLFEV